VAVAISESDENVKDGARKGEQRLRVGMSHGKYTHINYTHYKYSCQRNIVGFAASLRRSSAAPPHRITHPVTERSR
jgi:hypothetical protein